MIKQFFFLLIQFNISHLSALSLNVKLFYLTHRFDRLTATTLDKSETGSDDKGKVLHIPQIFSITGASTSDHLLPYGEHSEEGSLTLFQRYSRCILQPLSSSSSSSSSCRAISTDIPNPLSPLLPIVHCFRLVFRDTSLISTELLYAGSNWSSCLCSSM